MGRVTVLTRNFKTRWKSSTGTEPTLDEINRLLSKGYRIKRQSRLYRKEGDRFLPAKVLSIYWNPTDRVLIWVDEDCLHAVTVIFGDRLERTGGEMK